MRKPPKELVDAIVVSLESGSGWTMDRYYARHAKSGVSIWIANSSWALRIRAGGTEYGGVVAFGILHRWRRRVWRALGRAKVNRVAVAVAIDALHGAA